MSSLRIMFALACTGLLLACQQPNEPSYLYLLRLANVLEVDIDNDQTKLRFPRFPDARNYRPSDSQQQISIREFLGLRQCKLHLVIAERNSQIGKVASPSQRLKYDLAILNSGPDCLAKLEESQLKSKLSSYLAIKQQQLPNTLWKALLAQNEYRSFWQPQSHQPNYPAELQSGTTITDLALLHRFAKQVLSGDYQVTEDEFSAIERTLGRLRYGDGGQLLSELQTIQSSLHMADQLIEKRLHRKLCPQSTSTVKAKYLQNVVNQFFIAKLQVRTVKLKQRHDALAPAYTALEELLLEYADKDYQRWIKTRNAAFKLALDAPLQHAKKIQQLYKQCSLISGIRKID